MHPAKQLPFQLLKDVIQGYIFYDKSLSKSTRAIGFIWTISTFTPSLKARKVVVAKKRKFLKQRGL